MVRTRNITRNNICRYRYTHQCTYSTTAANAPAAAIWQLFVNWPLSIRIDNQSIYTYIHSFIYPNIHLCAPPSLPLYLPSINHDMMAPLLLWLMIWPHTLGAHMAPWCLHPSCCLTLSFCLCRQPLLSVLTSALTPASTSQSLDRRWGGQEPVTIETSAAACLLARLPALVWAETGSFYPYTGQGGERSRRGQGHREEQERSGGGVGKDGIGWRGIWLRKQLVPKL